MNNRFLAFIGLTIAAALCVAFFTLVPQPKKPTVAQKAGASAPQQASQPQEIVLTLTEVELALPSPAKAKN